MRNLLFGLAFLTACNGAPEDDNIRLQWGSADTFHVAARYKALSPRSEHTAVNLEGATNHTAFDEDWSDELVWTYQVVDSGITPEPSDELYPYAVTETGELTSLTVVRAFIDASLNDGVVPEADPVVYMVFRTDRDRLAALISFTNVDGERVERAFTTEQLGRSYSVLSQSMLTAAPTLLAPFSAGFRDESKVLENGSELFTAVRDEGVVDVVYEDELGGSLIASTYESGAPWPTRTVSDTVDARLLSDAEANARRIPLDADPPENYDFRAALRARVNLDGALRLDDATMTGGWEGGAPEGFRPWAGSWWPLSEAGLAFGYDDRDTVSDLIHPHVDALKRDMDRLSEEIRGLDKGSEAHTTKVAAYQDKQKELTDKLVNFYNGLLAELNGGYAVVANGQLVHTGHGTAGSDDIANIWTRDWAYDLNELSPFDKLALQQWADGHTSPNPFFASAWEILNQYNPEGGGWWGHCNGWSAAAILTDEPRETKQTTIKGQPVTWTTADQKGLMTEVHYSVYSAFYGARYNDENDDIGDLSAKHFHQIIQFYLRDQQVPLVFDTTADSPVWNYPAWWADVNVEETTVGGGDLINVNTATYDELQTLTGVGPALAKAIIAYREQNGPFQAVDQLTNVSGIGTSSLNKFRDQVTVSVTDGERSFHVVAAVRFTTDGVAETHVDYDEGNPNGFTNTYRYTLFTDRKGNVTRGEWDNNREHPDFAWVPYENDLGPARNGSENTYVVYSDVMRIIGDSRRK